MTDRYCVIGAGAAGITVAKNLKALGIPFDVIERENDVGGNWSFGQPNSSVYKSTHLLSSKPMTAYTDFPIPDDYPDYLSHDQVLAYLRSYARHFGIYEHIQFHTAVEKIVGVLGTPSPQSAPHREAWEQSAFGRRDSEPSLTVPTEWDVTLSNGKMRRYKGVIIANGHHWDANTPLRAAIWSSRRCIMPRLARFIHTQQDAPTKADTFRRAKAGPQPNIRGGVKHVATPRHFSRPFSSRRMWSVSAGF